MARPIQEAFCDALGSVQNPELDGTNPHFKSRFSTLKGVLSSVKSACDGAGIRYLQTVDVDDDGLLLSSQVLDGTDHIELSRASFPYLSDPQKLGSFITYMRRYVAMVDFGLVGDDDDDGNGASEGMAEQRRHDEAKRRLWASCKGYAERSGADPNEVVAGLKGRDDWADTAEAMNAIADELDAS